MKRINNLFALAILLTVFGLFLSACEGPEGPAGKDGVDGTNGTAVCASCHASDDYMLKQNQYLVSKHGTGIVFEEEAGRVACGGCHSGTGFVEAVGLGVNDPKTASAGPIRCNTCHDIHNKFDSTDFALRVTGPMPLRQSGVTVDLKDGNTCARCHQARTYTHTATSTTHDTINASVGSTYSRFGPHYGVQTNVFTNNGLEDIGQANDANPHMNVGNGCVSCHMATDSTSSGIGQHTFIVPFANLKYIKSCAEAQCHSGTGTVVNYTKAKAIGTDIAKIRRKLIDLGYLDTTQAVTTEGYLTIAEYFKAPSNGKKIGISRDTSKVILNYLYIAKDKSNGVHNPGLVRSVVDKMKTFLGIQ